MRPHWSGLALDIRLAARRLRHAPTYATAVVLIFTLGIGATTTLFSIVRGVVLRPLPFPESERLIRICEEHSSIRGFCVASPYSVREWGASSRTLSAIGLGRDWPFSRIRDDGRREQVTGGWASPGLFAALGVRPALGRLLVPNDLAAGANKVVVLSSEFWQSEFGGTPDVLNRRIVLDGENYAILGVLPKGAAVPGLPEVRLWVPIPADPDQEETRRWRGFQVIGRMAAGVEPAAVAEELNRTEARIGLTFPATHAGWRVTATGLRDDVVGDVRGRLWTFAAAALVLLLIACTNIAGLGVARGVSRARELALRSALGAGRGRLARLVLVESALLGLLGGALGLWVGTLGTRLFLQFAPPGIPRLDEVRLDRAVLLLTLGATLVSVLLSGLIPALRAGQPATSGLLGGGRATPRRTGPPRGLIAAEIALACVLLVGTGLVLRTLTTLLAWSPGFERERLSVAWTSLSQDTHPNRERVIAAYRGLLESAREAPGVASAGLVSGGPLFGGREVGEFVSAASAAGADTITAQWYDASPGYFGTMGLRLVAGRDLSETDTPTSPRVAIVNETFAHRLLRPGGEIGSPVVRRSDGTTFTVVGVVADVPPLNPDALTEPEIYWSQGQEPRWGAYLVVRARIDDPTLGTVLQARLGALEPGFTMNRLTSYRDRFGRQLISPRFNVILLGTFGLSALALALAGVYGLLSYSVAAGARDAAIRVALGGTEAQVVRRSLLRGLTPVGLGLVVGLAGATAVTRLMRGVVQGVPSLDPATYGGVAAVVGVTALLAAWFPTRRIGRMNTMEVLRSE